MGDELTFFRLRRNGCCTDQEHQELFDRTVFRTVEGALEAALSWLRAQDASKLLSHPWYRVKCYDFGHPSGCAYFGPAYQDLCRQGLEIEYRLPASGPTYEAKDGQATAMAAMECRVVRRWSERQAVVIDGETYAREVPREEVVFDWTAERPRLGGKLWVQATIYVASETYQWAESSS